MAGQLRTRLAHMNPRQWATMIVVLLVFCVALVAAGRALATGAMGEVLRVRFGGDAERTRVVVDLDRTTRGEVISTGDDGQVVVALSGIVGTPHAEAGLKAAKAGGLPVVGIRSGARHLRNGEPTVFHLRMKAAATSCAGSCAGPCATPICWAPRNR